MRPSPSPEPRIRPACTRNRARRGRGSCACRASAVASHCEWELYCDVSIQSAVGRPSRARRGQCRRLPRSAALPPCRRRARERPFGPAGSRPGHVENGGCRHAGQAVGCLGRQSMGGAKRLQQRVAAIAHGRIRVNRSGLDRCRPSRLVHVGEVAEPGARHLQAAREPGVDVVGNDDLATEHIGADLRPGVASRAATGEKRRAPRQIPPPARRVRAPPG